MTKKFKNPYTFPHRSRKAMVEDIIGFRAPYWDRHSAFPINFDVKAHGADLDFAHLVAVFEWGEVNAELRPGGAEHEAFLAAASTAYDKSVDSLWNWAAEAAWENTNDGDTYRMHWDGTWTFDVKFGLYGRQGGHLCVTEFQGRSLVDSYRGELQEQMLDPERWSFKDVHNLYKLHRQWQVEFTGAAAVKEIEYQAAWTLFVNLADTAYGEAKEKRAHDEALLADAKELYTHVSDSGKSGLIPGSLVALEHLCTAAGVPFDQVTN